MFQTDYLVYSSGLFENWNISALDLFSVSDLGFEIAAVSSNSSLFFSRLALVCQGIGLLFFSFSRG